MLRNITSQRHFWKTTLQDQLTQQAWDDVEWRRKLRSNEVMTMALNEIAAASGRGFFFHVPSRETYKQDEDVNHPAGRRPRAPRLLSLLIDSAALTKAGHDTQISSTWTSYGIRRPWKHSIQALKEPATSNATDASTCHRTIRRCLPFST